MIFNLHQGHPVGAPMNIKQAQAARDEIATQIKKQFPDLKFTGKIEFQDKKLVLVFVFGTKPNLNITNPYQGFQTMIRIAS